MARVSASTGPGSDFRTAGSTRARWRAARRLSAQDARERAAGKVRTTSRSAPTEAAVSTC
jgi:hypothetical protein